MMSHAVILNLIHEIINIYEIIKGMKPYRYGQHPLGFLYDY